MMTQRIPSRTGGDWRIVIDDLAGPEIQALLALHAEQMMADTPRDACHFLDLSGLQQPDVTVWSIWDGDALAGCGALRELAPDHGEIKSMRTATEHLGRGVGRRLLTHLLDTGRSRGYAHISLETGTHPSFDPAIALYTSVGFEPCGPFAGYGATPHNRFMQLAL